MPTFLHIFNMRIAHNSFSAILIFLSILSNCIVETQKERIELDPEELISYNDDITDGDEVFTVEASFQPLLIQSMKREAFPKKRSTDYTLKCLKTWTEVNTAWKNFGTNHFKGFLPPSDDLIESMQPYKVVSQSLDLYKQFRYNPPPLDSLTDITLHRLLSMFHPRPFLYTRSGPHGVMGCVRAWNKEYLDISLRVHTEFQLNEPPMPPVWFVPAHLSGKLIIEKHSKRIIQFYLSVPQDRHPNVVLEWLTVAKEKNIENMNEDIGYLPEMRVKATRDSQPMYSRGRHIRKKYLDAPSNFTDVISNIQWESEISDEEASLRILRQLYPFTKVNYHNFTTVWPEAKTVHKPVHFIVSQGYLDDQTSCQNTVYYRDEILKDSGIMDMLEEHFVSGWCVLNDLRVMESSEMSSSNLKKLAPHYISNYKFPFAAVVSLSNGKIVSVFDLERIFSNPFENSDMAFDNLDRRQVPAMNYKKFLENGLKEAITEMMSDGYNHDEL